MALSKWGSPSLGLVPDHRNGPSRPPLIVETDPQGRIVKTSHDDLPPEERQMATVTPIAAPTQPLTVDRVRAWLAERATMLDVVTRDLEAARAKVTELEALKLELESLKA